MFVLCSCSAPLTETESEAGLEAGTEQKPPAQKRLTVFGETARRKRTFARPRASWAYDGFAREERLKPRRVREIEVLQREIDDAADYALVQPTRLAPLMKVDRDGAAHQTRQTRAFCAPPATRPEITSQAIENARFAPGKAMVSKALDPQDLAPRRIEASLPLGARFCGRGEAHRYSAIRPGMAPQALGRARFAAGNCKASKVSTYKIWRRGAGGARTESEAPAS